MGLPPLVWKCAVTNWAIDMENRMEDVKRAFAEHLQSIGYEIGTPHNVILEKLRKRMGEQRFKEFQTRHGHSAFSQEEFYQLFQDIIEGNLMRSLDGCATLDASFSLYQRCTAKLDRGTRVLELGCWTGGLASFIATRHPQCSVVGADFAHEVVQACRDHYRLPNLSFQRWNYRWPKPDDLEPADVLLCAMGVVHHMPSNGSLPNPRELRRCQEYRTQRDHADGYFRMWRSAAREGGVLFAALRIGLFERFLAWMDGAQEAGWTPCLDRLWHVDMTGEKSPLPGLMFEARKSDPLPEDAVIDRWTWFARRNHLFACLKGAEALTAFRALAGKKVQGTREYRNNGLLTGDEVGVAGGTGYVFTHDAVSQFRMLLVSSPRAEELAAAISAKGSSTPINDEGSLLTAAVAARAAQGVFCSGNASAGAVGGAFAGGAFFSGGSNRTIGGGNTLAGASVAYVDD